MSQGFKRRVRFQTYWLLISQDAKTAKNARFHVFFTGWPHVFDHCAKTVCARRNPKTNVSSTINYISSDTTLITVVLVVLQITAWENWSNSKKMYSSLMATSWLLRIVSLLTTFDLADDKFDFAPVQSPDMRSSRSKKILVQGDEPLKLSIFILGWKGQFCGSKNKK